MARGCCKKSRAHAWHGGGRSQHSSFWVRVKVPELHRRVRQQQLRAQRIAGRGAGVELPCEVVPLRRMLQSPSTLLGCCCRSLSRLCTASYQRRLSHFHIRHARRLRSVCVGGRCRACGVAPGRWPPLTLALAACARLSASFVMRPAVDHVRQCCKQMTAGESHSCEPCHAVTAR